MPDDLNQRVQARLDALDGLFDMDATEDFDSDLEWMIWDYRGPTARALVDSWREGWDRHPRRTGRTVPWCPHDGKKWPCPDALSVCREIGVAP